VISLVSAFALCFGAITVQAAAWVLWNRQVNFGTLEANWQPQDAYPEYTECMKALTKEANSTYEHLRSINKSAVVTKTPSGSVYLKDKDISFSIIYKCFPDTIDPRK
jgi:hypothetical protein